MIVKMHLANHLIKTELPSNMENVWIKWSNEIAKCTN